MTPISSPQMQAPPLDEDYDYYSTKAPTGPAQSKGTVSTAMSSKQQPRVRKGLGAMPRSVPEQPTQGNSIREQQQQQHRGVNSPSNEVEQQQQGLDPPASSPNNEIKSNAKVYDDGNNHNNNNNDTSYEEEMAEDDDDALLDLDQLEELHDEAERMKALGNKHMAAQVSKIGKIKNCDVQTELEHNIIIFRQKIALSICPGKIDSGRKVQTNRSTIYSSHFIQMIYSLLTFNNEKNKIKIRTGIHPSIQCLFGRAPVVTRRALLTRFLVESIGRIVVPKTIFCSCHRCTSGYCFGTYIR